MDFAARQLTWFQKHAALALVSTALLSGLLTFLFSQWLAAQRDSKVAQQFRLLESIAKTSVNFELLKESDWKTATLETQLLLLEQATEKRSFETAIQLADHLSRTAELSSQPSTFSYRLANQWRKLGYPDRAFDGVKAFQDTFESETAATPELENFRSVFCRILIDKGFPSRARTLNLSGPQVSTNDSFERELIESEIRVASMWFDELEERLNSAKKLLLDPSIKPANRTQLFNLRNCHIASEKELRESILSLEDKPGEWSLSVAKLALAEKLLQEKKDAEGKTL